MRRIEWREIAYKMYTLQMEALVVLARHTGDNHYEMAPDCQCPYCLLLESKRVFKQAVDARNRNGRNDGKTA